jgi:bacillithiol biosynthesis cysteine-adding enzyme BshC
MIVNVEQKPILLDEGTPLFRDFLGYTEAVKPFFPNHFQGDWEATILQRSEHFPYRAELARVLEEQNRRWTNSPETFRNIDQITRENSMAVVTGQQVGIWSGPLFTLYKALAILQLSEKLQRQFPQFRFVPIFWMEVGDHDFREVNHVYLPNRENQLIRLELPVLENDFRSLHQRQIPREMEELLNQLNEVLPETEFTQSIVQKLAECYQAGEYFADAFACWMHHLLRGKGLVLLNPSHTDIKQMAEPVFRQVLEQREDVVRALQERAEALKQAGYHHQVAIRPEQTLLFLQDGKDAARCRIDRTAEGYLIQHPEHPYSLTEQELDSILRNEPYRFSPNVLLRPLMQDAVLPTVAYVAGPGEVSYWAQVNALYPVFRMPAPILYPRPRVTIVEKHIARLVEKFEIDYRKILQADEAIVPGVLRKYSNPSFDEIFENFQANIVDNLELITDVLQALDPSLEKSVEKTRNHMLQSLRQLQTRVDGVLQQRMEAELRQIRKILLHLKPMQQPQERILNILHYINKYDLSFVDVLYKSIKLDTTEHQLLFLR